MASFAEMTRSLGAMLCCRVKCGREPSIHYACYNMEPGCLSEDMEVDNLIVLHQPMILTQPVVLLFKTLTQLFRSPRRASIWPAGGPSWTRLSQHHLLRKRPPLDLTAGRGCWGPSGRDSLFCLEALGASEGRSVLLSPQRLTHRSSHTLACH